jgi:hypothetical protein
MNSRFIYIGLLILFIIILLIIINRNKIIINEHFASDVTDESTNDKKSKSGSLVNSVVAATTTTQTATQSSDPDKWNTCPDILKATDIVIKQLLTGDNEYNKSLQNMISSVNQSQLKTLIAAQSPLLVGPKGPQGPQGPAGTTLVASGRLINKSGSTDGSKKHMTTPSYVVTRTEGTNPSSSLSFMDDISPFASFQYWQLDINNNLKNRYDETCMTMNPSQSKLYIDKCSPDNPNQKWTWDNTNRLISTTASTNTQLKCIGLTEPESNILTSNVPGCVGDQCLNRTPRRYLEVKDCDINNINEDEVWSFI